MKTKIAVRRIILLLAVLTSPFACVSAGSIMIGLSDASIGFFNAAIHIENQTDESLYLTPITTTYVEPRIIFQSTNLRNKELPLRPGASTRLSYDAADSPLAGVVLCRENGDCRYLEYEWQEIQIVDDFDILPPMDESWLNAINTAPKYNFQVFMMLGFALTPFILFALWWNMGKNKKRATD